MKKAALHNLGCKVNAYETEAMQEMLEQAGYEIVPFKEGADVYIINTCTVTNIADRKSRQMLHRARKLNPDAVVVAAGCYVQAQEGKEIDPCIDIVIGNNHKKDLPELLKQYEMEKSGHTEYAMEDINRTKEYEELHLTKPGDHTRAYIKVQDGCNQFCTYCIIPYARGRVRSRQTKDVLEEVRDLAGNGYKEVVLTGIHLSSYGIDFDGQRHLLDLIKEVHKVEGIERIRLGSLEPGIITEEFAKELSEMPKVCPHFHLSLQSGCDATLKRMNRKYTSGEYYDRCQILRKYFDHPALTTDVIVGFPGETEEEFEASYAFVDRVDFYETHIFQYSRRKGTKAAVMENQVPSDVAHRRSAILIADGKVRKQRFEEKISETVIKVLFEESVTIDGKVYASGHTMEYIRMLMETTENLDNQILLVKAGKERCQDCLLCTKARF
mgnify:CR=1 FL=1